MIKRWLMFWALLAAGVSGWAGEVEDALKTVDAPTGEYVRMPAKYIFQRLERTAQDSGLPVLGGFSIKVRIDGLANKKVSVAFSGMNMLEALETAAKATGAGLTFDQNIAVFGDPNRVAAEPEVQPQVEEEQVVPDGDVEFAEVDTALVFVETGVGRGSAFIAEQDGKTYIFSNQHNFMGAKKLDLLSMNGDALEFETFEFCRSRDLVRFELTPEQVGDLGVLRLASGNPYIGQEVVVYGNSAGGNVATELRGEVLGVGPRDIEVDADIVPGNSGSPIIDPNREVIGVATYIAFELKFDKDDQRGEIFKGTRFRRARRYGVRIPSDGWTKVNMRSFLEQTYKIADWQNYLELTSILVEYWGGLQDYDDYEEAARHIMDAYSTRSGNVERPYQFHNLDVEAEVEMGVKSFKRNFEEFRELVRKADLSKSEMSDMSNDASSTSQSKIERLDYYIRSMMLSKARKLKEEIEDQVWMSEYLEETAADLEKMAGELVIRLEGKTNLYPRLRAADK